MGGAARSLPLRLRSLAESADLEFLVPGPGPATSQLAPLGKVTEVEFGALTFPDRASAAPRHALGLATQARRLRDHFRATEPDLVITSSVMLPTAVHAARREGIPVLSHCSVLLNSERLPSRIKRRAARALLARTSAWATTVVACSQKAADQFRGLGGPVEVVYPPIAAAAPGDGAALRERLGIRPGQPCAAVVGNITRGRGQDLAVRAMLEIRRRLPDAQLLIAGQPFERPRDIAYSERLDNLVRGLGLSDHVHMAGVVDPVADVFAAADVVINPARTPESFGRVACESLLAGTPVVSTRVGAVEEVLRDGRDALLVEPDSPNDLAGAVIGTLGDPDGAAHRTAAGAARVEARFDPGLLAERFAEIAAETIAREGARERRAARPAPSTPPPPAAGAPA